jgi:hypothetical protein
MDPVSIQAKILDRTLTGDSSVQNPTATNPPVDPIESLVEAQLQAEINAILYNIPTVFNICLSYAQHMLTILESLIGISLQFRTHASTETLLKIPR